jgi:AraC-like DNA-binding protein
MVFSHLYAPHPALQSFVRHYALIHVQLDPQLSRGQLPVKPYPPDTEQCLYFYPYDLPHSVKTGYQAPEHAMSGIVVGQPLTRMNITINPNYLMLKVSFQPGGLFRLFGVPMNLLTDSHAEVETITGKTVREIAQRLAETTTYAAMIGQVEAFLLTKATRCRQPILPIDRAARQLLDPVGYHRLDRVAADACLSLRQFERKFRERVGISPKLFSRIARFRRAYQLRETDPARPWIDIAYACHYHDPNHLIKDFQQFAGTNPGQLFAEEQAMRDFFARSPAHW